MMRHESEFDELDIERMLLNARHSEWQEVGGVHLFNRYCVCTTPVGSAEGYASCLYICVQRGKSLLKKITAIKGQIVESR